MQFFLGLLFALRAEVTHDQFQAYPWSLLPRPSSTIFVDLLLKKIRPKKIFFEPPHGNGDTTRIGQTYSVSRMQDFSD